MPHEGWWRTVWKKGVPFICEMEGKAMPSMPSIGSSDQSDDIVLAAPIN